ncbi:MAG: ROK family protein [Chitinophagaceae bacterium]|nr:ROK family protein [Chitinophagaceae bacterium]MCW5927822.1 ROK family protein [Chitinophagaceae bacterium]
MASKGKILSIDIGGSKVKATVLDSEGKLLEEYKKLITPQPSTPANVLKTIGQLAANFKSYQKVSVGFPGYVKRGIVYTAPNLGTEAWKNTHLEERIGKLLGKPCKVVNDADFQGVGIASGKGLELVVTLGTGFGTALLNDGVLLPHLELSQHPLNISTGENYDKYIGEKTLNRIGVAKWNKRLEKVLFILKTVFNYDRLYISGGNAKKIKFKLDKNITIANNQDGIKGGARLWK